MRIGIIKGDGIGPEVIDATVQVLNALDPEIEYIEAEAGYACYQKTGTPVPDETISMCKEVDAVLFGAVTTPPNIPNYKSAIVTMRKELDLYANIRPNKQYQIGALQQKEIDLTVVRENTEGLYSGVEERDGDTAITKMIITKHASKRIVKKAFELAKHKVTIVHKANILRETGGLFRETALEVAKEYPNIEVQEMLVDAMAMRLIKDPENFEIIVTTNLFGDILSDEASQLVGGLGLAASGNIGDKYAIFEPVHGSAPDIAGKGVANPLACIMAAKMMLTHIGEEEKAKRLENAVIKVLNMHELPPDLGGSANTKDVVQSVIQELEA